MRGNNLAFIAGLLVVATPQVQAKSAMVFADPTGGAPMAPIPGVLQCVPYARNVSGIKLFGDAHTWWRQAEGKYARGRAPRPGAVMAISPHGNSRLGHVATVSRVIDARTILISHANWSAPGKIERNVTATDVSAANDWSEVRVWYAPIQNLGGAHWPVSGFIYNATPGAKFADTKAAGTRSREAKLDTVKLERSKGNTKVDGPARGKLQSAPTLTRFVPTKTVQVRFGHEPLFTGKTVARVGPVRTSAPHAAKTTPVRVAPTRVARTSTRKDPIGAILASAR